VSVGGNMEVDGERTAAAKVGPVGCYICVAFLWPWPMLRVLLRFVNITCKYDRALYMAYIIHCLYIIKLDTPSISLDKI
jgi:hypothetical protein